MALEVTIQDKGKGIITVQLSGELDGTTSAQLDRELIPILEGHVKP